MLWLPLAIFVALLVTGGIVGRYVVPSGAPPPAPTPPTSAPSTVADVPTAAASPTLSGLPTPPARPADALSGWAARVGSAANIPVVATEAYGYAQLVLAQSDPACHLGWTTLAGIGAVESQHGQAGGAVLGPTGRSTPRFLGPALDGRAGRALVRDSDAGAFDADPTYDHAMGPLHLLPSTWQAFASDADGDGIEDPFDLDDAALALAKLLCSGPEDLAQLAGWQLAIARYRTGTDYQKSVFTAADSYGQQTRSIQ